MNQTLENLIKLQNIDQRLFEIKQLMGDLPMTVESQEKDLSDLQSINQLKKDRIEEIEKQLRHIERDLDDMTNKMQKHKDQLYLVKSNKEYDSLNSEIDHMKSIISENENKLLTFTEEKESLEDDCKINVNKIEELQSSLSLNKDELSSTMAETENEQNELEKKRSTLYKNIDSGKLDIYQRISKGRDGVGMESIIGSACGGCYSQLPPQIVIEIKKNININTCPNCSMLLFWDGAEE